MDDLREDFKNWLKYKNYKESTIKLYVRQLNRICKILYDKPNDWTSLVPDLAPLLICCIEYANKEYYISLDNWNLINEYFQEVNKNLHNEYLEKEYGHQNKNLKETKAELNIKYLDDIPYITISLIIGKKQTIIDTVRVSEIDIYLNIIGMILTDINTFRKLSYKEFYVVVLLHQYYLENLYHFYRSIHNKIIKYDDNKQIFFRLSHPKKNIFTYKNALLLFYNFLKENNESLYQYDIKYPPPDISNFIHRNQDFNTNSFRCITRYPLGNTPLQIEPNQIDLSKGILAKQLTETFRVSSRTIHKIEELDPEHSINRYYYSSDNINNYLQKHHFNVKNPYDGVDYQLEYSENKWCSLQNAIKILDVSKPLLTKMTRNGLLTHIRNTERSTLYYVPELEQLQKIYSKMKKNLKKYYNTKYIKERFTEKLKKIQCLS